MMLFEDSEPTTGKANSKADVGAFIALFCKRYKELRRASYFVRRPKDLTLARLLLETYGAADLAAMVDDLLTVDDEWIGATDRGIGILVVKASWLANRHAQTAAPEPVQEPWYDICSREHGSACRSRWEHEMRLRESA